MAAVASQRKEPASRPCLTGWAAAAPNTNRSRTTLVSRTSGFTVAGRAGHHVEAEQAALDRAVPHRHAARFLQAHARGQLGVRRQHPGRPAGVVLLPVRGELGEEAWPLRSGLAGVLHLRRLAAAAA